jgi:hypothetical protein
VRAQQLADAPLVRRHDLGDRRGERQPLDARLGRRLEPVDAVRVAGDDERALDLRDQLHHAQVARIQLHELEQRDHDAARMQVIRARADHAARIDEQPHERAVLRVDPRHRQVFDVGEPLVALALELRAHAVIKFEVGLGKRRRGHPHELVRLAVYRIQPRAQRRSTEPTRPAHPERDRYDEPQAHHEEEHFHIRTMPRAG